MYPRDLVVDVGVHTKNLVLFVQGPDGPLVVHVTEEFQRSGVACRVVRENAVSVEVSHTIF